MDFCDRARLIDHFGNLSIPNHFFNAESREILIRRDSPSHFSSLCCFVRFHSTGIAAVREERTAQNKKRTSPGLAALSADRILRPRGEWNNKQNHRVELIVTPIPFQRSSLLGVYIQHQLVSLK